MKLATHQVSGQKVALKIINRKRLVTRDMAGRIEREIQYLQLLRHPHAFVRVCGKGSEDGEREDSFFHRW